MEPIPKDLMLEIFSRLPAKSVAKFRSLSNQWGTILRGPDFTDLFLKRSTNHRPRLLFAANRDLDWFFFSSPQDPYKKSVMVDYHTKFSSDESYRSTSNCSYNSGLIYFTEMSICRRKATPVVCNPITGMYVSLPIGLDWGDTRGFLGFDHIDKQFKLFNQVSTNGRHFGIYSVRREVLTLGSGDLSYCWRSGPRNDCPAYKHPSIEEGICIDGVLYILDSTDDFEDSYSVIIRFDLRSEELSRIDAKCFDGQWDDNSQVVLINYKGKLGGVFWDCGEANSELSMSILEDAEKGEWLEYKYVLPENEVLNSREFSVVGMTARGEIVFSMKKYNASEPFYVFYFNPERSTLQSVEIKGFEAVEGVSDCEVVRCIVDHVEDLSVIDAEQLKSNIATKPL